MSSNVATLSVFLLVWLAQACDHKSLGLGKAHDADIATNTGGAVGAGSQGTGGAAGDDAAAAGADRMVKPSIVGTCTRDADCLAVLDYNSGFECWWPVAASTADIARDPCVVPWNARNPKCPVKMPPADCEGGLIAVDHSCFAVCWLARCTDGTCTLGNDASFPSKCRADVDAAPDCDTLRTAYFTALAAAHCDPAKIPTSCVEAFYDNCGCPTAADVSGTQGMALQCALEALQDAHCGFGNCGTPCPPQKGPPP